MKPNVLSSVRLMIERAGVADNAAQALRWILDILDEIVPGEVKAFLVLDDEDHVLRVATATGLDKEFVGRFERPVGSGVLAEVVWGGHVRGIRKADPSSEQYKELRLDRAFGSGVAAPAGAGGRQLGCLWVQADKVDAFGLSDLTLMSIAARLAGYALALARMREECARLVPMEPETGLLRHLEFLRRLAVEIDRAKRGDRPVSVLIVHLEGLTHLRAKLGKRAAVEAVCEISRILRSSLRGVDLVGRESSARIEACLPETAPEAALVVAERLHSEFDRFSRETWPETHVGTSIGIAAFPEDGEEARGLVAGAARAELAARRADSRVMRAVRVEGGTKGDESEKS